MMYYVTKSLVFKEIASASCSRKNTSQLVPATLHRFHVRITISGWGVVGANALRDAR